MNLNYLSPYIRRLHQVCTRGLSPAYIDSEYVFTHIFDGKGIFLLEDIKYTVKKGDMILMPPYMRHIINTDRDKGIDQYVIHFDVFFNEKRKGIIPKEEGMTFHQFVSDKNNPETILCEIPYLVSPGIKEQKIVEKAFLEIKAEADSKKDFHELVMKEKMLEILCVYLRMGLGKKDSGTKVSPKVWKNLDRAITYIHNNHTEPLTLEKISKEAGLSLNYFCQLFKDYTNTSVHRYLNTVRVEKAKKMLKDGKFNITQIAEETGFSTVHLFSRIFSKIEGMPPSKYIR